MSSLVQRLRVRSDSRPRYSLDESDDESDLLLGKSRIPENIEKIVRDDAKEGSCNACGESGNLLVCVTCTYEYHPKCLLPPLKAPLPTSWRCPKCLNPLNDIEKILDCEMRPTVADDSDASKLGSKQIFVQQYLVKWKGLSYLHCTWVPEKEFIKAYKELPRLRTKINNFRKHVPVGNNTEDDFVPIRPEYTMVDRILTCRQEENEEKEYYVKYVGLNYDECYWESESDISSFQQQIENFNRLQSRYRRLRKQKSNIRDAIDSKNKSKKFQQFEKSPEFLSGGELHPYQLEGLNYLRFSWSKQTHVILADEMGLGKTIQSIAFLASLYEENVSPHLVVAPLSTLRNWEREFATWAPHMNVVMYVGTPLARAIIGKFEFYFPRFHKKDKEKKSSHGIGESKQERIKFDVILTSYEMINIDDGKLKAINWETMIVDEGHRLIKKDSKLFLSLKQFNTRHRTLLTGTPPQETCESVERDGHQKRKRGRTPELVIKKPNGLLQGSTGFNPRDHDVNSPKQAIVNNAGPTTNYQQDWPFIKRSPVWATFEHLDLYQTPPQKPHFSPLEKTNQDYREGLAIAHMVTFGNLVQKLSDLQPHDPCDIINNNLKTLLDLETHGFDVGSIRARLIELLSLKSKVSEHKDTRKEVEKEIEKRDHEKALAEKEFDELKAKMQELKGKMVQTMTMRKMKEEEIGKLQSNLDLVTNQIKDSELAFVKLTASPL